MTGIIIFAKSSNLTKQQVFALSFALVSVACIAIGMSTMITTFNAELGEEILSIIAGIPLF